MKDRFAAIFRARTRDEWVDSLGSLDVCFAPVLTYAEAARDPHLASRRTYVEVDGVVQPEPAPRFGRTPARLDRPPPPAGHHTDEILADLGLGPGDIADLRRSRAIG
jgi:alpha-methylacyl-CoA racemase